MMSKNGPTTSDKIRDNEMYLKIILLHRSYNLHNADIKQDCWNPYNINIFVSSLAQFKIWSYAEHEGAYWIIWKT